MKHLVIGAGVIGASVAEDLARRGAEVTVIDMRSPGRGASQASAGIIAPYTEAHGDPTMLELGVRSAALFDAFIARAAASSGRAIDYARSGTLEVAFDDEDPVDLVARRHRVECPFFLHVEGHSHRVHETRDRFVIERHLRSVPVNGDDLARDLVSLFGRARATAPAEPKNQKCDQPTGVHMTLIREIRG